MNKGVCPGSGRQEPLAPPVGASAAQGLGNPARITPRASLPPRRPVSCGPARLLSATHGKHKTDGSRALPGLARARRVRPEAGVPAQGSRYPGKGRQVLTVKRCRAGEARAAFRVQQAPPTSSRVKYCLFFASGLCSSRARLAPALCARGRAREGAPRTPALSLRCRVRSPRQTALTAGAARPRPAGQGRARTPPGPPGAPPGPATPAGPGPGGFCCGEPPRCPASRSACRRARKGSAGPPPSPRACDGASSGRPFGGR